MLDMTRNIASEPIDHGCHAKSDGPLDERWPAHDHGTFNSEKAECYPAEPEDQSEWPELFPHGPRILGLRHA